MPELPEVEAYRALAASCALQRQILSVEVSDTWYLKRGIEGPALEAVVAGQRLVSARRRGKLLLLDTEGGTVLGLRFGMTGRLLVDGRPGVDSLLYSAAGDDARYERFGLLFADGGRLAVTDPRRLGGVEVDPDEDRLGPDALTVTPAQLRAALVGASVPVKARLMDQSRLAGVGNLTADEVLWRAGLAPVRPAGDLTAAAVRRLHSHLTAALIDLIRRGGSHTGDLMTERRPGGRCPRDGAPLVRGTVGGRTTWWCPRHQR